MPNHNLLLATFFCVTGSSVDGWPGVFRRREGGGGTGPPRATVDMKPEDCRQRESDRRRFVEGMEVRPRRAREAFWRCAQVCARVTRDMVGEMESREGGWCLVITSLWREG